MIVRQRNSLLHGIFVSPTFSLTNFSPLQKTRWYLSVPPEAKSLINRVQDSLTSALRDKLLVSFNQSGRHRHRHPGGHHHQGHHHQGDHHQGDHHQGGHHQEGLHPQEDQSQDQE